MSDRLAEFAEAQRASKAARWDRDAKESERMAASYERSGFPDEAKAEQTRAQRYREKANDLRANN